MAEVTSIPVVRSETLEGMEAWCREMADRGLLFHPDDPPDTIEHIETRARMFAERECRELECILDRFLDQHGNALYDACLRNAQRLLGIPPA